MKKLRPTSPYWKKILGAENRAKDRAAFVSRAGRTAKGNIPKAQTVKKVKKAV